MARRWARRSCSASSSAPARAAGWWWTAGGGRRQRDRGRVGTQSAAVTRGRRTSRAAVLLRPSGLHRDLSVGTGAGSRLIAGGARPSSRRRRRLPRAATGVASEWRAERLQSAGSRAPSARSSTCSIRRSSDSAVTCRTYRPSLRNHPAAMGAHVFSDRVDTHLVRATHGDSSGVRGAAWLWSSPLQSVDQSTGDLRQSCSDWVVGVSHSGSRRISLSVSSITSRDLPRFCVVAVFGREGGQAAAPGARSRCGTACSRRAKPSAARRRTRGVRRVPRQRPVW